MKNNFFLISLFITSFAGLKSFFLFRYAEMVFGSRLYTFTLTACNSCIMDDLSESDIMLECVPCREKELEKENVRLKAQLAQLQFQFEQTMSRKEPT